MNPPDNTHDKTINEDDSDSFCFHFQSSNQGFCILNDFNPRTNMDEKSNVQRISEIVSSFISSGGIVPKPVEIVDLTSDGKEDSDIELVDVIVHYPKEEKSNECCEVPVSNLEQKSSNLSEKFSATTSNQETQTINESYVCERDVENVIKSNYCQNFMNLHLNNAVEESISDNYLVADSVSMSNELAESDLCSSNPETSSVKDNIEIAAENVCEPPSDSVVCDNVIDTSDTVTNEYNSCNTDYDFTHQPSQIVETCTEFNSSKKNSFSRGCKWAPDGSCILTCNDDNKLRIFNLPQQMFDSSQWSQMPELNAVLRISEGGLVYDYCWYPFMDSNVASTCCLASTSSKSTVHLWDAYSGELRCSYRSYNHLDELVTPNSISFDSDGNKLFCGFQNVIRIFDVNRPGRTFEERQTYAYKTGQCGIISCFAFTSADKNISAAGSYHKTIGLYSEPDGELLSFLKGNKGGITHLLFSPDGNYLYSGGRKDPEILCWDIRMSSAVLFSLKRSCETNQRMYFDISRCGRYVVSGNQNGIITFWDVTKEPQMMHEDGFPVLFPTQFFIAHKDCVNGISLHPHYPILCSSSGQRKFPALLDDDSDAIFSSDVEEDNTLRLWWIGKQL